MQTLQRHGTRLDAVAEEDFAQLHHSIVHRQRAAQRGPSAIDSMGSTMSLPPRRADRGDIGSQQQPHHQGMGALSFDDDESPEAGPSFPTVALPPLSSSTARTAHSLRGTIENEGRPGGG